MTEPRGLKLKRHRDAATGIIRDLMELLDDVSADLARRGYQEADRQARERILAEMMKQMGQMNSGDAA
jgi:hypothetical protein